MRVRAMRVRKQITALHFFCLVGWVPEGSLAGFVRVGFRLSFGQTWPENPSRSTGLVLQCRLDRKSARQTNSKATSWRQKNPARLPSGTQVGLPWLPFALSGSLASNFLIRARLFFNVRGG